MQDIEFKVENQTLRGKLFYPENLKEKNPAILFVHGFTSEKERSYQYAKNLAKLGYICFLFDSRGHGESEGDLLSFTNKDFLKDVITAYDQLADLENVDRNAISIIGSSFGSYLGLLLTTKRKVQNIALRVPADYPNEYFDKPKNITREDDRIMPWREKRKNWNDSFALEAMHEFSGKILIIESELDDRIPHQTIENYVNAVKNPHQLTHILMKGVPHSIPEGKFRDEVNKILVEWFKEL